MIMIRGGFAGDGASNDNGVSETAISRFSKFTGIYTQQ